MSTYKNIIGKDVNFLTTDPDNDAAEGQIWYNSTDNAFKDLLLSSAWSSGSHLSTYRYGGAGGGTQTAAFVGGGYKSPAPDPVNVTEEYNGTGWATGGNMNTARMYIGGSGTQTAGLASGGDQYPSPRFSALVEEYDGSSWTVQNVLPAGNKNMGSCGIQTASLNIGGSTPSATNVTNLYDGTNWTNTGHNLNTARLGLRAVGTTTSALVNGGSPNVATTEEYNGSSWTSVNNSTNTFDAHASAGTQTAAAMFGGGNPSGGVSTDHNQYDGTTWTSAPSLALGRYYASMGPIGTQSSALCAGGNGPSSAAAGVATEEYNQSLNSITAGAWASGGTIPDSKRDGFIGSIGTQSAGIAFGGEPLNSEAYLYNGTSWTDSGVAMGTNVRTGAGMGTQTAAGSAGGNAAAGYSPQSIFQTYNGTSWSEGPDMNTAKVGCAGAGTITAALATSGTAGPGSITTDTEEYNGSSWSEQNNVSTGRLYHTGCGTQTAGIIFGGSTSAGAPFTPTANTEEYDGTNWTAGGTLITPMGVMGCAGIQTACITFGGTPGISGNAGSGYENVQGYDGTSWSTRPSMAAARAAMRGTGGTSTAAYGGGGYSGPGSNTGVTEDFTGETSALNIKTITTS